MILSGNIAKMRSEYADPVQYFIPLSESELHVNELIGKRISMRFTGQINCIVCGKRTKTSYGSGFCFNCMQKAPEASETVFRPELSKAHLGIARDMEWAKKHDLIPHFVYLAVSGGLKVGVTRAYQAQTRWIDQGADMAIVLAETPNRHIAGVIEVFLKNFFADKTNLKLMLQNNSTDTYNLEEEKQKAYRLLPAELQQYLYADNHICTINYPYSNTPVTTTNVSFDKTPVIEGVLAGIKGQYLVFSDGKALNVRKHSGYYIEIKP